VLYPLWDVGLKVGALGAKPGRLASNVANADMPIQNVASSSAADAGDEALFKNFKKTAWPMC